MRISSESLRLAGSRIAWATAAVATLAGAPAKGATLPSGFAESAISGSISGGTAMAFAPDGKLFVLEQGGTMEVYQGSGASSWTQVAPSSNFFSASPLSVNSSGERGLLGIAFDPGYSSNRFVYVYYTTSSSPIHNRVSRFTANAAGTQAIAGSESVLMDLDNLSAATNHNGGAMHFGPDGKLYVAVGDNASSSNAQSLNTRHGKMLRLNPSPGNPIPADNPSSISGIAGTTSGNNRAIWAAGLRNPFTFAFKPGTNVLYINDVGEGTWEEVSVGGTGRNFGWPSTEGPYTPGSFPQYTHPIIYYHHSNGSLSSPPLSGFTGSAITGGTFYSPQTATFPASYIGDYFFGEFVNSWIKRYDAGSNSVSNFASNAGNPVDLKVGPDGALYYLARGAGRVFRVQSTQSGPCIADVVPSGSVNVNDLLAVLNAWGPCPNPSNCPADIAPAGGDDVVNVNDLLALINGWGPCP